MSIAVIIPVLNEQDALPSLLNALLPLGFEEVILVDGNSQDRSVAVAKACLLTLCHPYYQIISSSKGRAAQMNAGAAQASADILLFLHADTQLPHNAKILLSGPYQILTGSEAGLMCGFLVIKVMRG